MFDAVEVERKLRRKTRREQKSSEINDVIKGHFGGDIRVRMTEI